MTQAGSLAPLHLYDLKPPHGDMRSEVLAGLNAVPKTLSPKFFYDERGSELFEAITRLPEYYPTRVELGILEQLAPELPAAVGPDSLLIEYGSGALRKVRVILDALQPAAFMPVDISGDHLLASARELAAASPELTIYPVCADYSRAWPVPDVAAGQRRFGFFPGSSIGNFAPVEAVEFLRGAREVLGDNGLFLVGVDRRKDPAILEAAYNDSQGVTAAFNRNILRHIRDTLGGDLDPEAFRHRAVYNQDLGRIEMYLDARQALTATLAGSQVSFAEGESVHTESSWKYHPEQFLALAAQGGFAQLQHWTDPEQLFSVFLLQAV